MTTSFFLGCSNKSIASTSSSIVSSVYNSSDEFQDAERAWDPTDHLVNVVVTRQPATPVLSRKPSSVFEEGPSAASPQRPRHISLPSNTFMAHGLPTCDDPDESKEFDFGKPAQKNLPKAPLDFLVDYHQRPPSPPYVSVPVPQNSPSSGTPEATALDSVVLSSFVANTDDEEMAAFLDDDDYPASNEDDSEEENTEYTEDTFFVDSETIKAAHESVLDLRSLLENNFSLIPGESVESLEKRALRMVHLEESFSVQDSFEPRTLLQDQDRAFIPWIPVIEDLHVYFEMRYPDMIKGTSRYDFHRARLVRNRTRLRILAQYVAQLEHRSRDLCRLSRSF